MSANIEAHLDKKHVVKGLTISKIYGRLEKIDWVKVAGTKALLFVPDISGDNIQNVKPVVLVFYEKHDKLIAMHETYKEIAGHNDCPDYVPKCHGIVQCKMKDHSTQEAWQQSALAFDQLTGKPISYYFDCNVNERGQVNIPPAQLEMCVVLALHHIMIPNANIDHITFDESTGRCMVWNVEAGTMCKRSSMCVCQPMNMLAHQKMGTECCGRTMAYTINNHVCGPQCHGHAHST